ncbi:MAG TPA: hypothetical protein VFL59_05410 [Candidatus Nanopelagicales bacterium]|nr:hypothetical protein [Candidatus Nanopelagicales bacterium]
MLRAGTVAGVLAVLALPTTAAQAEVATTSASVPSTGRIVSGEALAAAIVAPLPRTTAGPRVERRALGSGTDVGYRPVAAS